MNHKNKEGVVYLVVGDDLKYVREFEKSYNSLREHYSGPVSIITNCEIDIPDVNVIDVKSSAQDWQSGLLNKPKHLYSSPYRKTVFLDTDTIILDNFNELFDLLDHFDICAALSPVDFHWPSVNGKKLIGYLPYNTGVLAYNTSGKCKKVFSDWYKLYENYLQHDLPRYFNDQTPFNESVLKNKAQVCTLPNNYNLRANCVGNLVRGKVKILHDRRVGEKLLHFCKHKTFENYVGVICRNDFK